MAYSVQVRLEEDGNIGIQMAEMRQWLDRCGVEPEVFQYQMDAKGVLCRLDFKDISHADAFAEAFGENAVVVK